MGPIAILDANVLYDSFLRDILLRLDLVGIYQARWTDQIQGEWTNSLINNRKDLDPKRIQKIRSLMEAHLLDAKVESFEHRISSLKLPDPDDRHVLAAALESNAQYIVTFNLKDFPKTETGVVDAIHPDSFLEKLIRANSADVELAVRGHIGALKNPPYSKDEYIERFKELSKFAEFLTALL